MYNYFWEKNKYFFAIVIGAAVIGGFFYFSHLPAEQNEIKFAPKVQTVAPVPTVMSTVACGATANTIATKVIDGDTIVVEGGWHVRLLGMDADEKGYPCYDAAKMRLESLILGKNIALEKDVSDVDQYGRCLRYIFVGNTNVDVELVKEGLAVARFYHPDVKYRAEITTAETYAQQNKIGCKWSGAPQTAN